MYEPDEQTNEQTNEQINAPDPGQDAVDPRVQTELEQAALAAINTVFHKDPQAIKLLTINHIPANDALLYDDHFTVKKIPLNTSNLPGTVMVCADGMSLMNCVFHAMTGKFIVPEWTESTDQTGAHSLMGFKLMD
jgi:hypothetical protein